MIFLILGPCYLRPFGESFWNIFSWLLAAANPRQMLLERASKGGAAELTVTGDELQRLPCGTQGMKAVAEVFKD